MLDVNAGSLLEPSREFVGVDANYQWSYPLKGSSRVKNVVRTVWYLGLPLSSAHRGSHSGGGRDIPGVGSQESYQNEGTVYPHASLVERVTYHAKYLPEVDFEYIDMSHEGLRGLIERIESGPPDVVALSAYTATYVWALIAAAAVKRANPRACVIVGNDHAIRSLATGDPRFIEEAASSCRRPSTSRRWPTSVGVTTCC